MNYAQRRETWERCWGGLANRVPAYFSEGEYEKLVGLRAELFEKYLRGVSEVSEFGCGTGHNLLSLAWTGKRLRGFDWANSAVASARSIGIEAYPFDMLHPNMAVKVAGAVLTVHALEQLGADWQPFLDYLRSQKPILCIHIEPIEELYDASERDQARLAYHRSRGYLSGWLSRIMELELLGEAEILETRKSPFGGKDHDAYSVLVWRPL